MQRVALRRGFRALRTGSGPPLLYLHGFPDHPPTAAAFLARLGAHRTVTAPWLRGYAPSPLDGPFDLPALVDDAIDFATELGGGGAIDVVGHDWGAAITYGLCATAPHLARRAVTLALPHPRTFLATLRDPVQRHASAYMALFQLPGASRLVRANDFAFVDRLWRAWSPGFELAPEARAELHACLAASLPAPLGYYRALGRGLVRPRRRAATIALLERLRSPIETPLLQLHGIDDGCVLPPTIADAPRFARRELGIELGAGHFLHVEHPDEISARIATWLA